jgi:osmotically-inducible protein OsmY
MWQYNKLRVDRKPKDYFSLVFGIRAESSHCPTSSVASCAIQVRVQAAFLASNGYGDLRMKNDTQIQQEVIAELDRDENVPAGAIGVEVHHGVVKLAGRINDPGTTKSAELDAGRVDGVTKIVMDMGVGKR